jgi:DNA-binding MarR family transcriptional regulator
LRQNADPRKDGSASACSVLKSTSSGTRVIKAFTRKSARRPASRNSCPWLQLPSSGSNLHVEDFLTFRLARLSNALRTNLTKPYLEQFELSLPEWRVLALVARFAPMRFSEVTARTSMDKGQVSRTLRVMAKRGLTRMKTIRSARSSDALAAPVMVSVTARGRALYRSVLPVARRRQAELLMTLDKNDRWALYNTLNKLSASIGNGTATQDEAE